MFIFSIILTSKPPSEEIKGALAASKDSRLSLSLSLYTYIVI